MSDETTEPLKILIVEDEPQLNEAYSMILEKHGYEVHNAYDGVQAVAKLNEMAPDLILLDLRMPNLDGVGFLVEAKISDRFPDAIVIIFTNFDENEEIKQAFTLGANRYILKSSVGPKDLVKLVQDELRANEKIK